MAAELTTEQIIERVWANVVRLPDGRLRTKGRMLNLPNDVRGPLAHAFRGKVVRVATGRTDHVGVLASVSTLWQGSFPFAVTINVGEDRWSRTISTASIVWLEEMPAPVAGGDS